MTQPNLYVPKKIVLELNPKNGENIYILEEENLEQNYISRNTIMGRKVQAITKIYLFKKLKEDDMILKNGTYAKIYIPKGIQLQIKKVKYLNSSL